MKLVYIQDQELYKWNSFYFHPKSKHYFMKYLYGMESDEKLTICCGMKKASEEDAKKYKNIPDNRFQVIELPDFRQIKEYHSVQQILREQIKQADLCYIRCGVFGVIAALYCRRYKVPYVAVLNEDVYKNAKVHKTFLVRMTALPLYVLNRRMVKQADYACYVTQKYLQEKYPNANTCLACSDVEELDVSEAVLEGRINRIKSGGHKKLVLGTVGSVDARLKAHDIVIAALSELKAGGGENYIYQIVGGGNPERLQKFAAERGVAGQVEFLGEKSHEDVLRWMDAIDIYIHPSRSEGLPRTIIEALSRACPCICSNVGGIPELVPADCLFSHDAQPEKQLAGLIRKMTRERQLAEAEKNFERAKQYYPDLLKVKQQAFYEAIVQNRRAEKERNKTE